MTLASSVFSSSSTESRRCVSTTGFREDELKPGADKPDFYRILGINRNASIDQIKVAFREKAKQYHPDVNKDGGNMEIFKEINQAYAALSDPSLRRDYDASGSSKESRLEAIRRKNEGNANDRGDYQDRVEGGGGGGTAEERFRRSMERANERARDSAKFRGSMARINRARVHVADTSEAYKYIALPVAVASLWTLNYIYFM